MTRPLSAAKVERAHRPRRATARPSRAYAGRSVLSPGDSVDRYIVVRLLGTGGMGEVYEARDPRLQRNVALKVLRPDRNQAGAASTGSGPASATKLLKEARLAAALEHPNVVTIHDVGEIATGELAGTTFLAMELVAGETLRAYVGQATLPIETRLRWLRDVASALIAAHARGLVHRDVKPENVMIREDGVVKVLDFGIAKRAAAHTAATASTISPLLPSTGDGVTVGTPSYMAPEQMRGEPVDARADQFAWAVLAYELLAGESPWDPADSLQLVAQVLTKDPPLLWAKNPAVPPPVAAAVMRAMAKSREHRFPTMDALLRAMAGEAAPGGDTERPRTAPAQPSASTSRSEALRGAAGHESLATAAVSAVTRPRRRTRTSLVAVAVVTVALGAAAMIATRNGAAPVAPSTSPAVPSALPSLPSAVPVSPTVDTPKAEVPAASASTGGVVAPAPQPAPVRSAAHPATAPSTSSSPSRPTCGTPYYFDSEGIRRYKPECL